MQTRDYNALGEPMPQSADEALARQLVNELSELHQMPAAEWRRRPELRAAYDAKSERVRKLGYEIGPDGCGGLCLWKADNTGPLYGERPKLPTAAIEDVAPAYQRAIAYDRETRDFAMYLDGELVGFARTYHEAEVTLDQLVFELMSGEYFREAA